MAQKKPLISQKTNLRTLRYSKDQYGGGSSRQPFVKKQLEQDWNNNTGARLTLIGGNGKDVSGIKIRAGVKGGTPDFLLREGSIQSSIEDVSRLTQLLLSPSPATGPLFIAKQNLLSLANTNMSTGYEAFENNQENSTQIKIGRGGTVGTFLTNTANRAVDFIKNNAFPNQGIYSPFGTIAQAGVGAGGIHLNKQGLKPFAITPNTEGQGVGFPTYLNTIATAGINGNKSRIQPLFNIQIESTDSSNNLLYKYRGGPGSTLGVGQTEIKIAKGYQTINRNINDDNSPYFSGFGDKVRYVLTQQEINKQIPVSQGGDIINFSEIVRNSTEYEQDKVKAKQAIPKSIDYANKNADLRTNLGNPGKRGNISSYTIGKRGNGETTPDTVKGNSTYKHALDQITALPLYQSSATNSPVSSDEKNDLVKFRIAVLNNNDPSHKTYIHFRAFIDSMSDSYTSTWEAQQFMGRGENFYKYSGFDRSISLSWTVAAQSKQELIPMYQKLNYLASVCAPDYSDAGYMRGNLISLTVGGWCYEQVGIMKGITLDVPTESPWEIGISDTLVKTEDNSDGSLNDASVKELPMIVKVTGFQFTPIHNFVPKIQSNLYGGNEDPKKNTTGFISRYGKEKYIGLTTGANVDNYNGLENNLNYIPT